MDTRIETMPAAEAVEKFLSHPARPDWFLLVEDGRAVGLLPGEERVASKVSAGTKVIEIAQRDFCFVREDAPLGSVCNTMRRQNAGFALVAPDGQGSPDRVRGLITTSWIASAIGEASEAFEEY